jgi:hypothetical protein
MLFWVIFAICTVGFWIVRARQWGGSRPLAQGVEQAFFCAIILFLLSFFGLPVLDFKTGALTESTDAGYTKLRLGSFVYLCVVTPVHFLIIYLENRKYPR